MVAMKNPKRMAQNPSRTAIKNVRNDRTKSGLSPIPEKTKASAKSHHDDWETDMFGMRLKPVDDGYLNKFALEWVEAALFDDEMLLVMEWPVMIKRVDEATVRRWCKRNGDMERAHATVLNICGIRREKGGLNGKFDSALVRTSQAMYSVSWKELEQWRNDLKVKIAEHGSSGLTVVEIPSFGSSDLVPARKDEDV